VSASFCAEHSCGTEGRDDERRWRLTKGKGEMGGGPAWVVPCGGSRGEARVRSCHVEEDGV
jgi:hypothetical protein